MQSRPPPIDSDGYSEWKGWSADRGFGQQCKGDASYFTRELRDATRSATPVKDILEIGFGSGSFLSYCRSRGWNVTGTELLPEQVAAGRAAGFDVHLSGHLSELADHSFDLIAAFDVLEHIPESEAVSFLSTLAAKLRPEGTLFLRYPNADTWLGNAYQNGDPTHVSAIGYYKVEYLASRAALDIIAYRASTRRGFATSVIHGLHAATAGTLIRVGAVFRKMLYVPGTPLVLSSSNVVCVLGPRR